jgi:large subunit ribosomal protein L16
VRGGSGKGSPDRFVAVVKQGTVMFEVANIPESEARECLRKAGAKLNVCTKVIKKGERGLYE